MSKKLILLGSLLCLFFVSCASTSVALNNATTGQGKIAYANATTDNFYRLKVGTTVFNNKLDQVQLPGLADLAGQKHVELLSRKFPGRVSHLKVPNYQVSRKTIWGASYQTVDLEKIEASALAYAKQTGASILVLHTEMQQQVPGAPSQIKLNGYSQLSQYFLGMGRTQCVASNMIRVYDVSTGKALSAGLNSMLGLNLNAKFGQAVKGVNWQDSFQHYTSNEQNKFKNAVLEDSERNMLNTLKRFKL